MKKQTIQQLLTDIYYSTPKAENAVVASHYTDLTSNELHVLRALVVGECKEAEAVAKMLRINSYSVKGTLNGLWKKGYLTEELELTEKGTLAIETYKELIRKGIGEMIESMTDEEVDVIIRGLGFLSGYIEHLTSAEDEKHI